MRLLVIGGTVFVGRAIVEAALARGDEVTLFHRGEHGRDLFGEVERILGDREADLDRLAGRNWDAVVDTCGFTPAQVKASAEALADAAGHYVFISTAGVYRDWPVEPIAGEDAPRHESDVPEYSELKAASERELVAVLGARVALVRPGLIVGPHENIGRLPWWLQRMARGDRVMAPGPAEAPIQLVDVRDLADFTLRLADERRTGGFNVVSPPGSATWGELLELCRDATGAGAELVWVAPERVLASVEESWSALPMWPAPGLEHVYSVSAPGAVQAGLRTRPLPETVADTWAWLSGPDGSLSDWRNELQVTGLDPEIERALVASP